MAKSRAELIRDFRILKEKKKRLARVNMVDFVEYTFENYDTQYFHKIICEYLDKLLKGDIKKLMVFVPPQHGKSQLSSRHFPAFILGRDPNTKIGICSYSADLSSTFNRACQSIIQDPKYKELFPDTIIDAKGIETTRNYQKNSGIFETIGKTGFVKTVGVGGSLTGTPLDIGIIDDPFKDRAGANSQTTREATWQWYEDVFKTRLHNDSKILMLYTRWHEDDLAGRILDPNNPNYDEEEAKEWTVLCMSALKEETKALPMAIDIDDGREIDDALWESRHSAENHIRRRRTNPSSFASLYQQRPSAQEGNKILREWFIIKQESELPFNMRTAIWDFYVDGAFTDKSHNDETGLMSCTLHDGTLYIRNCSGVRKEMYEFLPYFRNYALSNGDKPNSTVWIEPKASGKPMKSMLSKIEYGGFNVREIPNRTVALGKWNRVEIAEPFLASGKIVLIQGPWNKPFIDQCSTFPNGLHDDMVDVFTYGVHKAFIKPRKKGASYSN